MLSARLIASIASGISALVVMYYAWNAEDVLRWFLGVLLFLAGVLFIISYVHARKHALTEIEASTLTPPPPAESAYQPPLLGDLLLHKYQCISPESLQQALELQKGTTKQLGDILLETGMVHPNDLKRALEDQEKYKYVPWFNEAWAYRRYQTQRIVYHGGKSLEDEAEHAESTPAPE